MSVHKELSNAAAMHEALKAINCIDIRGLKRLLHELVENDIFDGGLINRTISAVDKAKAALASPLRNCDAGTAEEQARRFAAMCDKYYDDEDECGEGCPLKSLDIMHGFPRCQAYWAQMPYEGGSSGSK